MKGESRMKKKIVGLLVVVIMLSALAGCKTVPDLESLTPLEIWNTYVVEQKNQPTDIYAVECSWGHPSYSSFLPPSSQNSTVIAETLSRLKTLTLSEKNRIEKSPDSFNKESIYLGNCLTLDYVQDEKSNHPIGTILSIYLEEDCVMLKHGDDYMCFKLDSDQSEFKESMVNYFRENNDGPVRLPEN